MDNKKLAVYGGPMAVRSGMRDRWRNVGWRETLKIVWYAVRDINTHFSASGPVKKFEDDFAALTDTRFALSMNSGTAALHSAYFAAGVNPGDEVIVPSYTFFASAAPILQCGARPVFCDIDAKTMTADPEDVAAKITDRTRAICVVHVWGNPAKMDRLVEVAREANVALIEDCSHAHGASYQGRPIGSWGDIGCFSLQGLKAVSGGEAGIAVTNNQEYFGRMLSLGHFGRTGNDTRQPSSLGKFSLGLKFRPHLYAMLLAEGSLPRLPELNRLRSRNYEILREELKSCEAVDVVEEYPESKRGGFLEFLIRYHPEKCSGLNPGAFAAAVRAEGVPLKVDRYKPLHRLPPFNSDLSDYGGPIAGLGNLADSAPSHLPVTETVCGQMLSMPAFAKVPAERMRAAAVAIRKVAELCANLHDFRIGA